MFSYLMQFWGIFFRPFDTTPIGQGKLAPSLLFLTFQGVATSNWSHRQFIDPCFGFLLREINRQPSLLGLKAIDGSIVEI